MMSTSSLVLRSLIHYRRTHLAVVLAVTAASGVLTGALVVGDSVKGSLRAMTLDRLGKVDAALTGPRLFRDTLAGELASSIPGAEAIGAILLSGNVSHGSRETRASGINLLGVDETFWTLNVGGPDATPSGRNIVLNEALAQELQANVGDAVVLRVRRESDVPAETLLGQTDQPVAGARLVVGAIVPNTGIGRFSLLTQQQLPRNAYVPLSTLQRTLEREERVNTILVRHADARTAEDLQNALESSMQLADVGLAVREIAPGVVSLDSNTLLIESAVMTAAQACAAKLDVIATPLLTYLANSIQLVGRDGDKSIPYSTVTAVDTGKLILGQPLTWVPNTAAKLGDEDIVLNSWAAEDLGASVGDRIKMTYYMMSDLGALETHDAEFRVAGIAAMEGLAADPTVTPPYPGIQEADSMRDWDPPFPVDLSQIRDKDETYWDVHRATPKAFVSLARGRTMWTTRFGQATSVRFSSKPGKTLVDPSDISKTLLAELDAASMGLQFKAVKADGLVASKGATDFSMLFISFSFFIIIAAAMLIVLLFRLAVEQRAKQTGLLLAIGYKLKTIRRLYLMEGAIVVMVGASLGLLAAYAYAGLMILALRTLWVAAVGTTRLNLHVGAMSLAIGFVASTGIALGSIWIALRTLGKVPPTMLLRGMVSSSRRGGCEEEKRLLRTKRIAYAALVLAAGMVVGALMSEAFPVVAGFFVTGACLLVAATAFGATWLGSHQTPLIGRGGESSVVRLSVRNASRNSTRSILTSGLVAASTFVIVAVGAMRHDTLPDVEEKTGGTGGFALLAESDVAIPYDLNSADGRDKLSIQAESGTVLDQATVFPFRLKPGDDASCLNLYQPLEPRVLGASEAFVRRGGFRFAGSLAESDEEEDNPWRLLNRQPSDMVIPAIGDANTVMWILHLGLGKGLMMTDDHGEQVELRIVGTLAGSIFQSELIISEEHFIKHFSRQMGSRFFLIEAPVEKANELTAALESDLGDYGLDVQSTADRVLEFKAVENTYISTFQMLGGLGLLLGTFGLAAVLMRNVLERRSELALLNALGFRRRTISWLLFAEHGLLLAFGLVVGTVTAMVAVSPRLSEAPQHLPVASLGLTLAVILMAGLAVTGLAVPAAMRSNVLTSLREE
jgi:ABC-type lipoprotein release transport system permease subunit